MNIRKKPWRTSIAVGVAVASLVLGACSSNSGSDQTTSKDAAKSSDIIAEPESPPAPETVLRIAVEEAPDDLDPATLFGNRSINPALNVFRQLVSVDENLKPVPGLASWETTDAETYVFTLKEGATFASGSKITAEDVAYSLNRVLRPETASPNTFFLDLIEGGAEVNAGESETASGIEVLNENQISIRLTQPAAYFPALASSWPYSVTEKATVEKNTQWAKPGNLAGSGDYRQVSNEGDIVFTYEAVNRGQDSPSVQTIEVHVVPEEATRVARFLAGEFDAAFDLGAATLARAHSDSQVENSLQTRGQLRNTWLSLDNSRPPFNDIRVRKAFNFAIDRQQLIETALGGLGVPAKGFVPEGTPFVDGNLASFEWHSQNLEKARSLLSEAGYPNGEGFPSLSMAISDRSDDRAVAQFLQAQLKDVLNVQVTINALPSKAYNNLINDPNTMPEMLIYGFGMDYPDAQEMLQFFVRSDGFVNYQRYSNEEFDKLLDEGNVALDAAARTKAYSTAHEIFLNEAPIVPLYQREEAWLVAPGVQGVGVGQMYQTPWVEAAIG